AVCVHQFLHCLDGVLQPVRLLEQQRMLTLQTGEGIGGAVEQRTDLLQGETGRAVHRDQVQPFDGGIGVTAVSRRGPHTGHRQPDAVVVVQGPWAPLSTPDAASGSRRCQPIARYLPRRLTNRTMSRISAPDATAIMNGSRESSGREIGAGVATGLGAEATVDLACAATSLAAEVRSAAGAAPAVCRRSGSAGFLAG